MKRTFRITLMAAAASLSLPALAAIGATEAAALGGPDLNEVGAPRAGNKDGSIPAYSGKPAPSGAKPPASAGRFNYGDPYAGDKPLYTVDARNMAQYADKLSEGTKALLQKYPTYKLEVHPTRRDVYFPADVLQNTPKCAQQARMVGQGDGIEGNVHRCVPFPIPKTGYEVLWNAMLRPGAPPLQKMQFRGWLIDAGGSHTLNSKNDLVSESQFNDPALPADQTRYMNRLVNTNVEPAGKAGTKDLRWTPMRMDQEEPRAWQYIAGQRRVRLAPEFKYDTVSTSTGGLILFDEINLIDGRLDRFDYSTLKLRELIVPFNTVKTQFLPPEKLDMKNHPAPEHVRWELRRVWEVSGPLKSGARHVYQRKTYYVDQDSWAFVLYDSFDQSGKIYRTGMTLPLLRPEIPLVNYQSIAIWDLTKDVWGWALHWHDGGISNLPPTSATAFQPDALSGSGVR